MKSIALVLCTASIVAATACTTPSHSAPESSAGATGATGGAAAAAPHTAPPLDAALIDRTVGHTGAWNGDQSVYNVSVPRTDVIVKVEGRVLEPFMGLTSWAAFSAGAPGKSMVMGDFTLFEDEINPVMSAALDNGLAVTAVHNHFFGDEPKVWFMHIGGEGTTEQLALGVKAALQAQAVVRALTPQPAHGASASGVPAASAITAAPLDAILGTHGQSKGGDYKAVFGRTVTMPCGCAAGADQGINTWAAFAGSDEHALVDGDFLTFEGELQPVLKTLRHAGIEVVAIHSHMEGEQPHAVFLHFWGVGKAADLAHAVRAALDAQAAPRQP